MGWEGHAGRMEKIRSVLKNVVWIFTAEKTIWEIIGGEK
jgi:hypothetical protein